MLVLIENINLINFLYFVLSENINLVNFLYFVLSENINLVNFLYFVGDVMVSVLASSAVDRGFES
jgi:hypothetical protein